MPSNLRIQSAFEPISVGTASSKSTSPSSASPFKKQKMSLTQTYFVASAARTKLGREAGRPDHDLRLLVGHANLLDSLMIELADAEREQEAWFNHSVRKAGKTNEPRHVTWIDTVQEEVMDSDDSDDSDDDSDSDIYDEDESMSVLHRQTRPSSPPPPPSSTRVNVVEQETYEAEDDYSDDSDDDEHALIRTFSHGPPELVVDDSDSSEDEASPPTSPPQSTISTTYFAKNAAASAAETALIEDGFYIPERRAPMLSVY
ncbi:hypothetical protein LTR66_000058 [Elasticomyces elasticus]|nr:hypothetical protein LTR66_000058 [Elasticomyces elasticus]KAK5009208.1 hypothetical protein LTR28_002159 [Elasticomyces elasticus]